MIDCTKTKNYFAEKARMSKRTKTGVCGITCGKCPLGGKNNGAPEFMTCTTFEIHYPQAAISIVQRWSNTHSQRTYLTEFLKHYPNVQLYDAGIPKGICPYHLGLMSKDNCRKDHNCVKCWNQHIPEDGEENDKRKNR